jgi:hypothetical protein
MTTERMRSCDGDGLMYAVRGAAEMHLDDAVGLEEQGGTSAVAISFGDSDPRALDRRGVSEILDTVSIRSGGPRRLVMSA